MHFHFIINIKCILYTKLIISIGDVYFIFMVWITNLNHGILYFRDRQEKKHNETHVTPNLNPSVPPTTHAHYRPVSSTVVEGQDDYLQPNTNTHAQKPAAKADEPLIHIWETPLPDPTSTQIRPHAKECTIHRNNHNSGNPVQIQSGSNPATMTQDGTRTGTSYYSPKTGHKYYVLDRA